MPGEVTSVASENPSVRVSTTAGSTAVTGSLVLRRLGVGTGEIEGRPLSVEPRFSVGGAD